MFNKFDRESQVTGPGAAYNKFKNGHPILYGVRTLPLDKGIYYLLVALAFGVATLASIPKPLYKKFFIYGLLFGGAFNVLIILVFSGVFHLFAYLHIKPFGIWDLFSFWTPITWIFTIMIYLYFLPVRRIFLYPYMAGFIIFGYMMGQVLKDLGLFKFYGSYMYFEPLTFIVWFTIAAWAYIKGERVTLR
jgi:hypothetical protein